MRDPKTYDRLSTVVFVAGVYEGAGPFLGKLFDREPALAFPLLLSAPWWWIVAALTLVLAFVLLTAIDTAKRRAQPT